MLGITGFGLFHTLLSVIAVVAGAAALLRHKEITLASRSGAAFALFTAGSCVTGLFLFHHGGFGKPHVLAIVTLAVLALATLADRRLFGKASRYTAALLFSLAFFFHFIPGFTETLTRLPLAQPWASGPDDPGLAALIGATFVLYLIGAALQAWRIRADSRLAVAATA